MILPAGARRQQPDFLFVRPSGACARPPGQRYDLVDHSGLSLPLMVLHTQLPTDILRSPALRIQFQDTRVPRQQFGAPGILASGAMTTFLRAEPRLAPRRGAELALAALAAILPRRMVEPNAALRAVLASALARRRREPLAAAHPRALQERPSLPLRLAIVGPRAVLAVAVGEMPGRHPATAAADLAGDLRPRVRRPPAGPRAVPATAPRGDGRRHREAAAARRTDPSHPRAGAPRGILAGDRAIMDGPRPRRALEVPAALRASIRSPRAAPMAGRALARAEAPAVPRPRRVGARLPTLRADDRLGRLPAREAEARLRAVARVRAAAGGRKLPAAPLPGTEARRGLAGGALRRPVAGVRAVLVGVPRRGRPKDGGALRARARRERRCTHATIIAKNLIFC
jgi:hypothetical protein